MLIIFAGLPGTGKTTLAKEISRRIGAVYLRIDSIEQAITNSSLAIHPTEDAGYLVGYALAEDNLRLGWTVVADSVNPIEMTRADWLAVAERVACAAVEIEVVCSEESEHRRRVETREPDLPGAVLPSWQDVLARGYDAWDRPRVVIDTAGRPVEESLEEILAQLPRPSS